MGTNGANRVDGGEEHDTPLRPSHEPVDLGTDGAGRQESSLRQWLRRYSYIARDTIDDSEIFRWIQRFVDSPEYQLWLEGPPWFLWCYGPTLVGKTMFCVQVIQELRQAYPDRSVILSLFIDSPSVHATTTTSLFCSILDQLITQIDGLRGEKLQKLFDKATYSNSGPDLDEVLQVLSECLHSSQLDYVFVVVDGWNSFYQETAFELKKCLKQLMQEHSCIRILISSCQADANNWEQIANCSGCYTSDLSIYFYCNECTDQVYCVSCYKEGKRCMAMGHEMSAQSTVETLICPQYDDLFEYVRWRIDRLIGPSPVDGYLHSSVDGTDSSSTSLPLILAQDPELQETISTSIAMMSFGSFSSAKTHCDAILVRSDAGDIRNALKRSRDNLSNTYSCKIDELSRMHSPAVSRAIVEALSWISIAQRSLRFDELCDALSMSITGETHPACDRIRRGDLIMNSWGIVQISTDDVVIVPPDVQEWLCQQASLLFVGKDVQHAMKLLACLNYDDSPTDCQPDSEAETMSRLESSPLLRYACQSWAEHVIPVLNDEPIYQQLLRFLRDQEKVSRWAHVHFHCGMGRNDEFDVRKGFNGLHLAAYHGLDRMVKDLVAEGLDVNSADYGYMQTALIYACRKGHVSTTRLLLELGADPHKQTLRGSYAIFEAYLAPDISDVTRDEMMRLLLDQPDLDINVRNGQREDMTLLMLAADSGDDAMTQYLIRRSDIKINSRDLEGMTALIHAVRCGHESTVKMLLCDPRTRTDIESHDLETALSEASKLQGPKIASYLLEHTPKSNMSGKECHLAFCNAIITKSIGVVQLFIDQQFPTDVIEDVDGTTYVHKAILAKSAKIAQLMILDAKIDANCRDKRNSTPLHYASRLGSLSAVAMLLDAGANRNLEDCSGRTPLVVARQNAGSRTHFRVMHLLDVGLDGDNACREQINSNMESLPTWSVVQIGQLDELRRRINSCDRTHELEDSDPDTGNTGLHCAVLARYKRRQEVLKLLLEAGVRQDLTNHAGETALYLAVQHDYNYHITMDLLASVPAPLEAPAHDGTTPLLCAQRAQCFDIAIRLISAGAESYEENQPWLQDTFVNAVSRRDGVAVERLLAAGADPMWAGSKASPMKVLPMQIAQEQENEDGGAEIVRILERQKTTFDGLTIRDRSEDEDSEGDRESAR